MDINKVRQELSRALADIEILKGKYPRLSYWSFIENISEALKELEGYEDQLYENSLEHRPLTSVDQPLKND